jgi:hypothetical protein
MFWRNMLPPSPGFKCVGSVTGLVIYEAYKKRREGKEINLHIVTLKMDAACSSEMTVSDHKTTRCQNSEDHSLNCQQMSCYSTSESLKWKTG